MIVFSHSRRCGPKRRKSCRDDSGDDSDATSGAGGTMTHGDGNYGHGGRKVLNTREQQFLTKFYGTVNKFIPMTCLTVIRDAMNPLPLEVMPGVSTTEVRFSGG